ncbi:MAG: NUDIX hydrolase [Bacteroidales bacterium]
MKNTGREDINPTFIKNLSFRLKEALPGPKAWKHMMPEGRLLDMPAEVVPVESAVLVLFIERDYQLFLLLIRRSEDGRIHGGQIGFPGGRAESSDIDLWNTALREAQEETGIAPETVEQLGLLSPLYIPHSNFRVHPHVGYTSKTPTFVRQKEEVDEILMIPYPLFFDRNYQSTFVFDTLRGPVSAPCFAMEGVRIWGATAMIISELISISPAFSHPDLPHKEIIHIT